MPPPSRRAFLKTTGLGALGFLGLGYAGSRLLPAWGGEADGAGFGPLEADPEGVLDLPAGFSYTAFSAVGQDMDDGLLVPAAHDGMAAFRGPGGKTVLVRNHELTMGRGSAFGDGGERLERIERGRLYDAGDAEGSPAAGGTTTLVFDTRSGRLERHFLSLAGTVRNCSGGPTPWGSWISCEESLQAAEGGFARDHGYCFEVPASVSPGLADPRPLRAMGRLNHEAVAADPRSGLLYLTEDRHDGLFYRFVPAREKRLAEGGALQALAVVDRPGLDTSNLRETAVSPGAPVEVRWIDLDGVDTADDDLRYRGNEAGAARFVRGEGIAYADGAVYFACTQGGRARRGQVWRYTPDPDHERASARAAGTLELLVEPNDPSIFDMVDNLVVAPWGDVILCEDGMGENRVVGVTPEGSVYTLARNALNRSELAGATFSPDGTTLFVNIQTPGVTLAITGPWGDGATERRYY